MPVPELFKGFYMAGFECSTQRRTDGRRLDLLESTGHSRHTLTDYQAMRRHGLHTVRDGVRWHLIEREPRRYDVSSFLPMLEATHASGVQPIWDLCHYGVPDHIDIWRPEFVHSFAAFARFIAGIVRNSTDEVPFYCPINEVSYWSWAGGDRPLMHPAGRGRGLELKHQLVRATIAAIEAVRDVDPRARFVSIDPLIHVQAEEPGLQDEAEAYTRSQYDGWLMLTGELWPGLGGHPSYLDIVGLNYYDENQWWLHGSSISRDSPYYVPLRKLLKQAHRRLDRPFLLAETGAEGVGRAPWLAYVTEEVFAAMGEGVPIEGICLYPVLDYPGWSNDRHCETGLLGVADTDGRRKVDVPLLEELQRQQERWKQFTSI